MMMVVQRLCNHTRGGAQRRAPQRSWCLRVVGGSREEKKGEDEKVGDDGGVGMGGGSDGVGGVGGGNGGDGDDGDVGGDGGDGLESRSEVRVEEVIEVSVEEVIEEVIEETGAEPVVTTAEPPVTHSGGIGRRGEPKGKGVATEEPVTAQGSVISPLHYAECATQEDVMDRVQKNPAVLDAVLTAVREAEIAQVRATEEERDAEAWAQEFEEEEEAEVEAQMEAKEAREPRVTVVEKVRRALAGRPGFVEATYDPSVHLFGPSGIDGYTL